MSSATDATTALLRALNGTPAGAVTFSDVATRGFKSPTFKGARHGFTITLEGEDAEGTADRIVSSLDGLSTTDGHLLADISIVSRETKDGAVKLRLEALTLEEAF